MLTLTEVNPDRAPMKRNIPASEQHVVCDIANREVAGLRKLRQRTPPLVSATYSHSMVPGGLLVTS